MSRPTTRTNLDLLARARREALGAGDHRELTRLLASDPALAFIQRAGLECDQLAPEPGDEHLIERATAAALTRLHGPSSSVDRPQAPRPRLRPAGVSVLSIATLAVLGYGAHFVVGGHARRQQQQQPIAAAAPTARLLDTDTKTETVAAPISATPAAPQTHNPTAAELFRRANLARRNGELSVAESNYRRLIQAYPRAEESQPAQLSLAKLLSARGANEQAEAVLRRSLAQGAGQLAEEALVLRAESLRALARAGAEAAVWRRLLHEHPHSAYEAQARSRLRALDAEEAPAGP